MTRQDYIFMLHGYIFRPFVWSLLVLLIGVGVSVAVIFDINSTPEKRQSVTAFKTFPDTSEPKPEALDISLIQLIANPEKYHGKFVRVIGYVHLEFEGNAIYLHQEDYMQGIHKNGMWLDVSDQIRQASKQYSDKYSLIEGTFNAESQGHMGASSGSIQNIKRFEGWRTGSR